MKHLKKFNESVNESKKFEDVVDMKKLESIANGILHLCMGEYGYVYIDKENMKISVCLGDANPFGDFESLEDWIRWECVQGDHDFIKNFDIEIDCEWVPSGLKFDGKKWR